MSRFIAVKSVGRPKLAAAIITAAKSQRWAELSRWKAKDLQFSVTCLDNTSPLLAQFHRLH